MTIKPRARRFHIRRAAAAADAQAAAASPVVAPPSQNLSPDRPPLAPTPGATADAGTLHLTPAARVAASPAQSSADDALFAPPPPEMIDLAGHTAPEAAPETAPAAAPRPEPQPQPQAQPGPAARAEAPPADMPLTARQLRMARRVAQRHGIAAGTDRELIDKLRAAGIDPFQRVDVLEMVGIDRGQPVAANAVPANLPQTYRPAGLPAPDIAAEADRARDILRIQRDLVRRRRLRFGLMMLRLTFFVFLPTFVAGWYYYRVATPLFATKSEFLIQQATSQTSNIGSLFAGTQFATAQDSIAVQSYLQSREAMLRLDRDLGFKAHFSQPQIDGLQRLAPDASNEDAYKVYSRNVKISFDPTEGIVKMEVSAADPVVSAAFSEALISYAEEQVDQLTGRLRGDQMDGARSSYEDAEAKMRAAQARVLELQERLGVLDVATESGVVMNQVGTFETEVREKRLQLQQLLDNESPNQARVEGVRGDIARLDGLIAELRASLTDNVAGSTSLAAISGELRVAEADLETRQLMLAQALQQMETARIEANKQVRYLSLGVSPTAPDEATYPRALENTLLALCIFAGIYLMMSLTASILREQVTS